MGMILCEKHGKTEITLVCPHLYEQTLSGSVRVEFARLKFVDAELGDNFDQTFPLCIRCRERYGLDNDQGNFFDWGWAIEKLPLEPVCSLCFGELTEEKRKFMNVQLLKIAHARSGDKGDTANIGLIALKPEFYPILVREVTAERVKQHFAGICKGNVERYELPNLGALNFLLHEALGGGGTVSLKTDPQGKTLSSALLRMEVEVEESLAGNDQG